jgi:hypothetical protein
MLLHHGFHLDRYLSDRQTTFLHEAARDRLIAAPTHTRRASALRRPLAIALTLVRRSRLQLTLARLAILK